MEWQPLVCKQATDVPAMKEKAKPRVFRTIDLREKRERGAPDSLMIQQYLKLTVIMHENCDSVANQF
jgi:hypothetical protein